MFWKRDKFASEQEAQEALEAIEQVEQPLSKRFDELKEEIERNDCTPAEKRIKMKEKDKLGKEIGKFGKEYERFVKKVERSKEGIKKW